MAKQTLDTPSRKSVIVEPYANLNQTHYGNVPIDGIKQATKLNQLERVNFNSINLLRKVMAYQLTVNTKRLDWTGPVAMS